MDNQTVIFTITNDRNVAEIKTTHSYYSKYNRMCDAHYLFGYMADLTNNLNDKYNVAVLFEIEN
jgi:hypothetical protein